MNTTNLRAWILVLVCLIVTAGIIFYFINRHDNLAADVQNQTEIINEYNK